MALQPVALCLILTHAVLLDNSQALSLAKIQDQTTLQYDILQSPDSPVMAVDLQKETLLLSDTHKRSAENKSQSEASGIQPVTKVACSEKEKLFSSTGLIIVACLSCLSFLLLYTVILLMAVPRLCFPYHPDSKKMKQKRANMKEINKAKTDESSKKPLNLPSGKINKSGRNDSGIESVDGLMTGNEGSTFIDRLYYFDKAINRPISDDELVGEERRPPNRVGVTTFNGKRPRSQSVAIMPSRYQSGIYIEL
ncbi:uncharacterized protein LOC115212938 [Octopus sinensis]|uniref:Uncharacterized protein LOC115212938 n=1 Tax=Octopus sinensis TaxID=2607531 RepID=A0A6P7SGU8_9MOLL|nr:uncharacterized protein LOC115212938 [Octopus sinensis]